LAIVVSDISPIRALAHLDLLVVLEALFGGIVVPPAVDRELLHPSVGLRRVDVFDCVARRNLADRRRELN
jgi:predicted nucleic acid-binding protein